MRTFNVMSTEMGTFDKYLNSFSDEIARLRESNKTLDAARAYSADEV